ncbi:hypothetical protein M419DRAFT_93216 [Trichoderma reesei RUT C-30]|uniref:Zn(2)-C6 fungal-type domain-containing protein n=1 Tax=Hypocrea jecorina (strain ATCC 56765 / BCRC 32924 / NRRL 11460 / Rut C-30) TaxID=1344414 RepID=A0A024RUS2_HYPJR|nr:hypothetical protein M419DRAFT_93216 [Trichoderma reesei RUT C-30]
MAGSPAAAFSAPSVEAGRGGHHHVLPPYQSQPQPLPRPLSQSQHQPQSQPPKSQPHPELSVTSLSSTSSSPNQPKQKDHHRHQQQQQQQQQQPPTKRRRIGYACNLCRTKKNRCDGERPSCGPCKERRQECVYSPQRTKISVTQEYVCVSIVIYYSLLRLVHSSPIFVTKRKSQWPLLCCLLP